MSNRSDRLAERRAACVAVVEGVSVCAHVHTTELCVDAHAHHCVFPPVSNSVSFQKNQAEGHESCRTQRHAKRD